MILAILLKEKKPETNEEQVDIQYQHEHTSFSQVPGKNLEGNWVQIDERWCYQYENGTFATDTWVFLDGERYHFDKDGWMQVGWIEVDGKNYYLNEDGVMLHDAFTTDGYYLNLDGIQTDDELMVGDGISYMVRTDPRGQDSHWDMYYHGIETHEFYILNEGRIFDAMGNVLTPEILYKINIEAVEKNSIILNYENYKDGYCSQSRYIDYDEEKKKAIVIGEYIKVVDEIVEKGIGTYGGTALIKRYNLETGKMIEETKEQLK